MMDICAVPQEELLLLALSWLIVFSGKVIHVDNVFFSTLYTHKYNEHLTSIPIRKLLIILIFK